MRSHTPHPLVLLLFLSVAAALSPDPSLYTRGPVRFDDVAELWYAADLRAGTARFALRVVDPAVVNASLASNWIAVGVSEPTSGSMLGGDILSAQFIDDDNCEATDRYVPFFAFPLSESTADSPSAFPFADDCQDDGSWVVRRCQRDVVKGEMLLEVSRPLKAHDTQDRDIVEGANSMIYAYGNEFQYHGGNRGAMQVVLLNDEDDLDALPPVAEPELPDDVDGTFEMRATNYEILSNMTTTYACTSKQFELDGNARRMIVAAEPIFDSPVDMIHHFTMYLCSNRDYARLTKETTTCMSLNGINGPLANPASGCSTFVYGYAKGGNRIVWPREAGLVVDKTKPFLVLETHYDNSDQIEGNNDNSGVRLYYTDTMRKHEAGSIQIGDSLVTRGGRTVENGFEYEHSCPSECTSKFNRSIKVYGSFLHMHTTGKEIYTNVFSRNGTFLDTMNKINFWSDRFQQGLIFDPPYAVHAGQQLLTTCVYDTSKRPETRFGLATTDEMCINFIGYYPMQRDPVTGNEINVCAYLSDPEDPSVTATLCGDSGKIDEEGTILPVPNPKFQDRIGAATTFGEAVETCPTPGPLESGEDLDASPAPSEEEMVGDGVPILEENDDDDRPPALEESDDEAATPMPTDEASVSESPGVASASADAGEGDEDDDNVCFPGSATVELRDGRRKTMREVSLGDEVLSGADGGYSRVILFTHRDDAARYAFVEVRTGCGQTVRLTRGHFLYVNGALAEARTVRVGDEVQDAQRRACVVDAVRTVWARGLFNPQTRHGDLVVDGVRVTTYTKAVDVAVAHALLAPVRWAWAVVAGGASV